MYIEVKSCHEDLKMPQYVQNVSVLYYSNTD